MSLLDFGKKEEAQQGFIYTEEQLMARLKFFIGVCLSLTLTGIVFVVLYSLIFVTQPLNAISPIDQKFFELIVPIATFLTGTLSGIMLAGNDKDAQKMALQAATRPSTPSPMAPTPSMPLGGNTMSVTPMAPFAQQPNMMTPPSTTTFTSPLNNTVVVPQAQVITGFGGKPAPAPAFQPEI